MNSAKLTDTPAGHPSGELLTPEQAAAFLHISKATLAIWRCTGRYNLPFIKLHRRRVVYRLSDLIEWVEKRAAAGTFTA